MHAELQTSVEILVSDSTFLTLELEQCCAFSDASIGNILSDDWGVWTRCTLHDTQSQQREQRQCKIMTQKLCMCRMPATHPLQQETECMYMDKSSSHRQRDRGASTTHSSISSATLHAGVRQRHHVSAWSAGCAGPQAAATAATT